MWRSWIEHPPQIPWAPIHLAHTDCKNHVITTISRMDAVADFDKLSWSETGIYREEFYQVTGRWE